MTPPKLVVFLTCLLMGKKAQMNNLKQTMTVYHESGFISANVGDNLTLRCFYDGNSAKYYWYKQTVGQKPRLVSLTKRFDTYGTFYHEFKDDPRFTLETKVGENHLKISDVHLSDSATYYCADSYSLMFTLATSNIVSVKASRSNIPALVHQSASESVQPGGSVTLNCTVHTGTCDGEHSVYWFKNSGLIYTHGGRNDQCERKPDTQTQTCVYNLPMKSLDLSHAGTYYCAVASCGHILFGNGTKLDFEDEENSPDPPDPLVYILSGALAFTTILVVLLSVSVYEMKKRNSCQCAAESQRTSTATNTEGNQDADNLHYAALSVNLPKRPRRQRNNPKNECVYSSVRQ